MQNHGVNKHLNHRDTEYMNHRANAALILNHRANDPLNLNHSVSQLLDVKHRASQPQSIYIQILITDPMNHPVRLLEAMNQ